MASNWLNESFQLEESESFDLGGIGACFPCWKQLAMVTVSQGQSCPIPVVPASKAAFADGWQTTSAGSSWIAAHMKGGKAPDYFACVSSRYRVIRTY